MRRNAFSILVFIIAPLAFWPDLLDTTRWPKVIIIACTAIWGWERRKEIGEHDIIAGLIFMFICLQYLRGHYRESLFLMQAATNMYLWFSNTKHHRIHIQIGCVIVVGIGLLQTFGLLPVMDTALPAIGLHLSSTFNYRNFAAHYVAMVLPYQHWTVVAGGLVYLLIVRTRAAWLACIATGFWMLWKGWRPQTKQVIAVISICVISAAIMEYVNIGHDVEMKSSLKRTVHDFANSQGRIAMWKKTVKIIKDKPLFGIGLNNWTRNFKGVMRPHNDVLWVAAEQGIPVALLWIFMFVTIVWRSKNLRASGAIIAYMVISMFSFPMARPMTASLAWYFLRENYRSFAGFNKTLK